MNAKLTWVLCLTVFVAIGGCSDSDGDQEGTGNGGSPSGPGEGSSGGGAGGTLSFTPPAGWTVQEGNDDSTVLVASRPLEPGDTYVENIRFVRVSKFMLPDTLEEWATKQLDNASNWFKDVEVVSNRTVRIGNVEAREIVYTCSEYNVGGIEGPFLIKEWLILGDPDGYYLTAASLQSNWDKYGLAIDAAAQSLNWQ
jgi:hypothetical protein